MSLNMCQKEPWDITERDMTLYDYFIFGTGFRKDEGAEIFKWSPDDKESQNGHMLIVGGSGSGKTRLLKKI